MDELERLLNMRAGVPERVGLEERIIAATVQQVYAFILLPRPLLMMIFLLFIGVGMGLYSPDFEAVNYMDILIEDESFGDVI